MDLDEQQLQLLLDIESFTGVRKYRGMMPNRMAIFHEEADILQLLEEGLMERVLVDLPCGSETRLYKLTDKGVDILEHYRRTGRSPLPKEQPAESSVQLTRNQWILLKDAYHYSQIHRFGGIMPTSELDLYDQADVKALYAQGLVLRVKVEAGSGKKRKGVALSRKGLKLMDILQ